MLNPLRKQHRLMMSFTSVLLSSVKRPAFLFLFASALTVMGVGAVVIYYLEWPNNPKIPNMFEALYLVVTTMTGVGYGDITPITFGGKLFAMILMLLGTAIFVCFTAFLSTLLIEAEIDFSDKNK